jgi:hypothetical protein
VRPGVLRSQPKSDISSQGSEQEKTFGPTISGLIHKHIGPERLLLWDSKARGGRPDSMKILKEAYAYWDAEGKSSRFSGLIEEQPS